METWFCCLTVSRPLSDEVRMLLNDTARKMFRSRNSKEKVRSPECEGAMTTEFKRYCVSSGLSGIFFRALIDTDRGRIEAKFLFRPTTEDYKRFEENVEEVSEPGFADLEECFHAVHAFGA